MDRVEDEDDVNDIDPADVDPQDEEEDDGEELIGDNMLQYAPAPHVCNTIQGLPCHPCAGHLRCQPACPRR